MRFSEYFKINRHDDDDWFDVDVEVNLPYFLDPYLILRDESPKWAEARMRLHGFYAKVHSALASIDASLDNPAPPKILNMAEPREFRLGAGKYPRSAGRGLRNPLGGIKLPVPDMQGPWEAGVTRDFLRHLGSFDRISDMTCVALKEPLIQYTQSIARRHYVPMQEVAVLNLDWDVATNEWVSDFRELPIDRDGQPIILTPERFISGKSSVVGSDFRESEFVEFLTTLLERAGVGRVESGVRLSHDAMIDIAVTSSSALRIIECKKRAPQTSSRLEEFIGQIKRYAASAQSGHYRGLEKKLTLATPGKLAATHQRYLASNDVSVWDGPWIYQQATRLGLQDEAKRYVGNTEVSDNADAFTFGDRLSNLAPGRDNWTLYQRLCQEIFEYLFCPPLRTPIRESRNENGVNRRDFILPNYSSDGYWDFLRKEYRADYIVVDPKNYAGKIGKERVLQVANYLQRHGTGLFGIIVCRNGADRSALHTIREQWILHDKMIIILQDADLLQMLTDKSFGNDPVELIRQKIEDFRLGV
ncbi:hypothetical protein [Streptomyces sp. NPDC015345]|uniref:hypothetical protein n=1 Tax=Streptomyces sp. NPDC015345 TaxID=3364953 RepID=UPI0036FAE0ED